MSTTTSTPYEWLKKIPTPIVEMDEIPLVGYPPPFPWENFTSQLAQNLEIHDLKVQSSEFQWRTQEELFSGMGDPLVPLCFAISPLEGKAYWAMAEEDIKKLMSLLLLNGGSPTNILGKGYQEGFYHFLALEVLHSIEQSRYDANLTPKMIQNAELPTEAMLCMDVSFTYRDHTALGRLFLSPELRKSIRKHFSQEAEETPFTTPLANTLEVTVHLEAGSTTLTLPEWSQVKSGDFLLLDRCSLKPGGEQGRIILTINGQPLFRGKIKDGNIKILEHPLYQEVSQAMYRPEEEEEEIEEEGIEEEEIEEEEIEEEEIEEDEIEEEEGEEEGEEREEEGEEREEEEEEEEIEEEVRPEARLVPEKEKKVVSPNEIPLPVVVEVGRIKMTVKTLMDLKPGNILELDVHPERSVDLVINGSRVGKGELIQVGETLGVRILKMG